MIIEPRWPFFDFMYHEEVDDLAGILRLKERDTFDIVVEHFDETKFAGGCKETIWAVDLEDLLWWRR